MSGLTARVDCHLALLHKRGHAMAAEHHAPTGQAYGWYSEVLWYVPRSGRQVAKQVARVCGDNSQVTIPWRSLADAVGVADTAGRTRAYTERGVQALVEAGWLKVETVGRGRSAKTTFYLMPGEDRAAEVCDRDLDDEDDGTLDTLAAA